MDIDLTRYDAVLRRKRRSIGHRVTTNLLFVLFVLLLMIHFAAPLIGPALKVAMCEP